MKHTNEEAKARVITAYDQALAYLRDHKMEMMTVALAISMGNEKGQAEKFLRTQLSTDEAGKIMQQCFLVAVHHTFEEMFDPEKVE